MCIPPQLQRDPELAALALLAATIDVAQHALIAEHPDMHEPEVVFGRAKPIVSLLVAREMVGQMEKLRQSITWYRLRLEEEEEEDQSPDDLPFWPPPPRRPPEASAVAGPSPPRNTQPRHGPGGSADTQPGGSLSSRR